MAWIQSHQSLLSHRKTGRLARVLRMSRVTAVGHLHAVWWWCLDNAPDGDITDITDDEIAEAAMWEGEPSEFVDALIGAGFVDRCDGQTVVHDWDEYAGKLVAKRKTDAERKRRQRQSGHPSDVQRTSVGHPTPVTVDGAGREEKRREEKKNTPHTPQGALAGFDQFWAEYPNKVGKAVAQKAWIKVNPDEQMRALIMAGLQRAKQSPQWTKDGGQFIPHPSTWLNQRRWEDEYAPPLRLPKGNGQQFPADDGGNARDAYRAKVMEEWTILKANPAATHQQLRDQAAKVLEVNPDLAGLVEIELHRRGVEVSRV